MDNLIKNSEQALGGFGAVGIDLPGNFLSGYPHATATAAADIGFPI